MKLKPTVESMRKTTQLLRFDFDWYADATIGGRAGHWELAGIAFRH